MAPFTPFFTESMYQNLRRIDPSSPPSVHFTSIPAAVPAHAGDAHIEASVERMQRVIELGRTIRERHNKPTRTPLKRVIVVHEDTSFLQDVSGVCMVLCMQVVSCGFSLQGRGTSSRLVHVFYALLSQQPPHLPQACCVATSLRSSTSGSSIRVPTQCSMRISRPHPTCRCLASAWARCARPSCLLCNDNHV